MILKFLLSLTLPITLVSILFVSEDLYADCKDTFQDVPYSTSSASAGIWDNLVNNTNSLRFESLRLLVAAESSLAQVEAPANFCPSECTLHADPLIVSKVFPQKYFTGDYPEAALCSRLEKETAITPVRFGEKTFDSTEEFSKWFSEFSRGNGSDGKDLYEKCPGDCSIRYETAVRKEQGKIKVDCNTRCGVARDKDVNLYTIALFYRWVCANKT